MTPNGATGWIRRYHARDDSAVRLVCLPHAGGSASVFHPFSALADPAVEVLAVQYPGRQDRRGEPAVEDLVELARHTAEHLAEWADRPLAFFGHSMGALVAYETARQVEARGGQVVRLFASGRGAPSPVRADLPLDEWPDDRVVAELRRLGGTDSRLLADDDVVRMMLPALRADYRAMRRYRGSADARLDCPITALVGDSDVTVSVEEAGDWRAHTTAGFDRIVFPGGHFYLYDHLREVLDAVAGRLTGTPSVR